MITRDSTFTGKSTISREAFGAVLREAGSPVADERDTDAYYDACTHQGVDVAFVLAVFRKESNYATDKRAVCVTVPTHSWGNTRTEPQFASRDADGNPVTADTGHGLFTVYPDWLAGCLSTAYHLSRTMYAGLTISDAIHKWAPSSENNTELYISQVVDSMNEYAAREGGQPKGGTMRVILAAGHVNIGDLTDDRLGPGWGDRLRTSTGSLGTEGEGNQAVCDEAASLLRMAGVDVAVTDACYHDDVYGQPADLCVIVHHDGVSGGNDRPQHAGAVPVHTGGDGSGRFTADAFDKAAKFAESWKGANARIAGVEQENLDTVDMEQIYSGYYPTEDTPTVCVECSIWGSADDGKRQDVDTGREAHALAAAIVEYGGIGNAADSTGTGGDTAGGGGGKQPSNGDQSASGHGEFLPAAGGRYRTSTLSGDNRRATVQLPAGGDNGPQYDVSYGFLDRWLDNGDGSREPDNAGHAIESAVARDGWPLTGEWTYAAPGSNQPVTLQVFERAVYIVNADGNVEAMDLGRVWLHGLGAALRPQDAWIS